MLRKFPLAMVCAVFASQACLAGSHVRITMGRANTTFEEFRQDREDCAAKSATEVKGWYIPRPTSYAPAYGNSAGPPHNMGPGETGPQRTTHYRHDNAQYIQCMKDKGYQEIPANTDRPPS